MPLSLRFVVPLALALAAIAYAVVPLVDRLTFQWFVRDLDARGALIAQTAQEPLAELMREQRGARTRVLRYFERIMHGERIYALGFCDGSGKLLYASFAFPNAVKCAGADRSDDVADPVNQVEERAFRLRSSLPLNSHVYLWSRAQILSKRHRLG